MRRSKRWLVVGHGGSICEIILLLVLMLVLILMLLLIWLLLLTGDEITRGEMSRSQVIRCSLCLRLRLRLRIRMRLHMRRHRHRRPSHLMLRGIDPLIARRVIHRKTRLIRRRRGRRLAARAEIDARADRVDGMGERQGRRRALRRASVVLAGLATVCGGGVQCERLSLALGGVVAFAPFEEEDEDSCGHWLDIYVNKVQRPVEK